MEIYRLIYRNNEDCEMNLLLCSERDDDILFENVTHPCLIKLVYISVSNVITAGVFSIRVYEKQIIKSGHTSV